MLSGKIFKAELTDYLSQFDYAAEKIQGANNDAKDSFHNGITGEFGLSLGNPSICSRIFLALDSNYNGPEFIHSIINPLLLFCLFFADCHCLQLISYKNSHENLPKSLMLNRKFETSIFLDEVVAMF